MGWDQCVCCGNIQSVYVLCQMRSRSFQKHVTIKVNEDEGGKKKGSPNSHIYNYNCFINGVDLSDQLINMSSAQQGNIGTHYFYIIMT